MVTLSIDSFKNDNRVVRTEQEAQKIVKSKTRVMSHMNMYSFSFNYPSKRAFLFPQKSEMDTTKEFLQNCTRYCFNFLLSTYSTCNKNLGNC